MTDSSVSNSSDILTSDVVLKVHCLRSQLYEELHSRPSPIISGVCQVTHLTVLNSQSKERVLEHVIALCERYSVAPPAQDASCYYQDFGGFELRWERHAEFTNFTFIVHGVEAFSSGSLSFIPKDWLASMPGELMVALNMALVAHSPTESELHTWFEGQRVIGAKVADERGELYTAFKIHSDGFTRFLTYVPDLNNYQIGRLVQRITELETYRIMALMSLPVARNLNPKLGLIDAKLSQLNQQISDMDDDQDERELLKILSPLAADVEGFRSETNYRFSATIAYHDLVRDRLKQLKETPIDGMQTLSEMLERRLTPGIKTCVSVGQRLEDLSHRIDQTTSLLRTRVDLSIQEQNQASLDAMNHRSELQLRLQQTVEGLSVVVIGYYLLGLLSVVFAGLISMGMEFDLALTKAIALPIVLLLVAFGSIHARKRIQKSATTKKSGKNPP